MPINEAFTDVTSGQSVVSVPTRAVSEAVVDGVFTGTIALKMRRPGGDWITVNTVTKRFSSPVNTPDANTEWTYFVKNVVGTVNVYFGP